MGRESRRKKTPPTDPDKAARIQEMLAKERELRASLERGLQLGKELSHRAHYAELTKSIQAQALELLTKLKDLFERDRVEILGQCFLANHELQQECERLQDEIDKRSGRPPRPDPLTQVEPLLAQLPKEQADALRLVMAVSASSPPAPEASDAFAKADAFVAQLEAIAADLRRDVALLYEVMEERARRGWADGPEVERYRPTLDAYLAKLDAGVDASRKTLTSSGGQYEVLSRRRQELRETLEGLTR